MCELRYAVCEGRASSTCGNDPGFTRTSVWSCSSMHCWVFLKVALFLALNLQRESLHIITPSREGSAQTGPEHQSIVLRLPVPAWLLHLQHQHT